MRQKNPFRRQQLGCVLLKRKKQKARPKGVNPDDDEGKPKGTLESESRSLKSLLFFFLVYY